MTDDSVARATGSLDDRVRQIMATYGKKPGSKPLMIEFAGQPKAGKTTCIETVAHYFRKQKPEGRDDNLRVFAPTEGVSKRTPWFLKDHLLFYNTWAACYALTQLLEARWSADNYDIAIFDRGIFDVLGWIELLHAREDVPDDVQQGIETFMKLTPWRQMIDLVVLFRTDPETSLRRENEHKLIEKSGTALNPEVLAGLETAYKSVRDRSEDAFPLIHLIDSSEVDGKSRISIKESAGEVVDLILGLMEAT